MVSLETLILSTALVLLAVEASRLRNRLFDLESHISDLDADLEYQYDYNNDRWQAVVDEFEEVSRAIQYLDQKGNDSL